MTTCCVCTSKTTDLRQQQLMAILDKYANEKGALIPVMQEAQELYGYLSPEVLKQIAESLKLPYSKVYGVVTFYAQFRLQPLGRHVIRVCLGTACHVRGGSKILEALQNELNIKDGETTDDQRFTLESVACIGACGLAPVMMINENAHGRLTPDKVKAILALYQ